MESRRNGPQLSSRHDDDDAKRLRDVTCGWWREASPHFTLDPPPHNIRIIHTVLYTVYSYITNGASLIVFSYIKYVLFIIRFAFSKTFFLLAFYALGAV